MSQKNYGYKNKIGKEIKIAFLDGKILSGKLIAIQKYEIIIEAKVKKDDSEPREEVSVFKHSIKYIF